MTRSSLLLPLLLLYGSVQAQQNGNPPTVVRSAPMEMKSDPNVLPAQYAIAPGLVAVTGVEVLPALPDCDASPERDDCTAEGILSVLRQHAGKPALDLAHAGDQPVTITFLVNRFGEMKDIRVEHPGDPGLSRMAIVALHDLPKFIAATQGGAKVDATLRFSTGYADLFPAGR